MFCMGFVIIVFFISIAIHYLRIEKSLRNTYIITERKVKKFLEDG